MKLFLKRSLILTLALIAMSGRAATIDVACEFPAIQTAILAANEGDIINIAAGSCTWSNSVTFPNRSFSIVGAGTNSTIITSAAAIAQCVLWNANSTNLCTISNIQWIGNGNATAILTLGSTAGSTTIKGPFLVHNCTLTNIARSGITIGYGGGFGLITRCSFAGAPSSTGNNIVFGGNQWLTWTNASNPMGTTNLVCVEDCVSTTPGSNGHFDAYDGAQWLIRRTLFDGSAPNGVHGYDSQVTSTRFAEVASCTFTNLTAATSLYESRGGVLLYHDNVIYAPGVPDGTLRPELKDYRGCNGSYQDGTGYSGYYKTNRFTGLATGGSASTLLDTRTEDLVDVIKAINIQNGMLLKLVSGTGSGQSATVTTVNPVTQFNVAGGSFSPAPDSTTGYELWFQLGQLVQVGNQPKYTFKSSVTGGDNISRNVLLGASMAESLTNLMSAINLDPGGSGVLYAANTGVTVSGKQLDLQALSIDPTTLTIILTNILDGTNALGPYAHGYPGAMQPGMLSMQKYTSAGAVMYGSYCWDNTINGTNVNFSVSFSTLPCNGLNLTTNLMVEGLNYFNTMPGDYTSLVYPHPLAPPPTPPPVVNSTTPARLRRILQ